VFEAKQKEPEGKLIPLMQAYQGAAGGAGPGGLDPNMLLQVVEVDVEAVVEHGLLHLALVAVADV
jgi:hypothetical protein